MSEHELREQTAVSIERGISRKNFLQMLGASFAALAAGGCKIRPPQQKIIPHLDQAEGAAPGLALWYASTCGACSAACGTLVKSRDGRPIKMEGNPDHPLSGGGLCARGQASILDLYDSQRLRRPSISGSEVSWAELDQKVRAELSRAESSGRGLRLVSRTLSGPSERAAMERLLKRYPKMEHVVYDPISSSAILDAHFLTHGRRILPHYRFDQAKAIVSFGADFLGTWISPVEFAYAWAQNRKPGAPGGMSWHAQFEARMSPTGANADLRVPIKPSREFAAAVALGRILASELHWKGPAVPSAGEPGLDRETLRQTAAKLKAAGRGLVVSGSNDVAVQAAVNWINEMLGSYGSTVDIDAPSLQQQGSDNDMDRLLGDMKAGKIGALIVYGANPAYDCAQGEEFAKTMRRVETVVAVADRKDETASLAGYLSPASHALESWGDAEPVAGTYSLMQPLVSPLFDSRPPLENLLAWSGKTESAYDFVKETWRREIFPRQRKIGSFASFWDNAVRSGAFVAAAKKRPAAAFNGSALKGLKSGPASAANSEFELVAYSGMSLSDGRQANNPWLQELPDAVTKAVWGNCASFAPADARRLNVTEGRVVRLSAGGKAVELPAHLQPGQAEGTVAAALGFGRRSAGPIAGNFPTVKLFPVDFEASSGADLFPFSRIGAVSVETLDRVEPLAKAQEQDSLKDPILGQKRPLVEEADLGDYLKHPEKFKTLEKTEEGSLWPKHEYPGDKWAMSIDLNLCTGCSACVVACRAENNVPIVGKSEVRKNREMSWIRIDRYYDDAPQGQSPDVSFQPMLCQHCDNAPCETVCPVIATSHSTDGLNMQVYNRCVGTRYCDNNCPFKVRHFNWFDYSHNDALQNLALNPDVTVRSRGVIEKCSFCVQRIYAARFEAREDGRELQDGDVTPACVQTCPSKALVFGNSNDRSSRVSKEIEGDRGYRLLAELGIGPSIVYKTKVRNGTA